jgi:hypothetical protein
MGGTGSRLSRPRAADESEPQASDITSRSSSSRSVGVTKPVAPTFYPNFLPAPPRSLRRIVSATGSLLFCAPLTPRPISGNPRIRS